MKPIPGHPMYLLTERGEVYSLHRNKFIRPTLRKGDTSYYKVGLLISSEPKRYRHCYIHQLLMWTYVGPCPPGMQIDHIDGDATNNKLENLRYVTPKENVENRTRHGRQNMSFKKKINHKQMLQYIAAGLTQAAIAECLNVSERQVSRVLRRYRQK